MKTVGIIGGLGPQTSAEFGLEVINLCLKKNKKQRPPILSWNVPMPIKVERDLIRKNIGEKRYLSFLIKAAKTLEKAGPDFLVLPCNSMHIFIEEIRDSVKIPMLSIVDETLLFIKKRKISKVGILATSTTIKKNLFQKRLKAIGVKTVIPDKRQQKKIDKIIHNLVMGEQNPEDKIIIDQIIESMKIKGIRNIILACTDLQLIIKERLDVLIFDTMQILAKATANKIL